MLDVFYSRLRVLQDVTFGLFSRSDYFMLNKADVLLICHDVDRPYTWRRRAYSPMIDSLREKIESLGLRTLSLAHPISRLSGSSTWSNALSVNKQYVSYKILQKTFHKPSNRSEVSFWEKIIAKVEPHCVIAIQPSPALSAAGKNRGVKVFDVQHGIIESSVYYNDQLSRRYGLMGFPDGVLVWVFPSEQAVKSCLPGVKVIRIGNSWLNRFLRPSGQDELVVDARNSLKVIRVDSTPVILVSLQWSKGRKSEIIIEDFVSEALRQLFGKGWTVWIRFHPIQIQSVKISTLVGNWQKTTKLIFDGLKVVDVSKFALPALLECTTVHLTSHSASTVEADFFGVPTLLWRDDRSVREWFKYYIQSRNVLVGDGTSSEIVSWADECLRLKKDQTRISKSDIDNVGDMSALLDELKVGSSALRLAV